MPTQVLLLALSLALAGEGPVPAAPPAADPSPAADAPRDWDKPPPGTKADQELWLAARQVNVELVVEQHEAARLANAARGSGYLERLPELARQGALPKVRADELAQRLHQGWSASFELMQRQWPVSKIRVCGYELLNFETVMIAPPGSDPLQASSRKDLEECVGRARVVLGHLKKSNEELQAALDAIGRELAALPPSRPAPAAGPAAAPPPSAASPGAAATGKPD
jgi:hypothetical protein